MPKRLVVTADDVGLHHGMTLGALRAHRDGIVTACSIVAGGEAFDEGVRALAEVPTLAVGIHLALVEARPVLRPDQIPSLVAANGTLVPDHRQFALRFVLGRIRFDEVERELRAQIEKCLGAGLKVEHVNSHQHIHALPKLFALVVRLAEEYRIGYVRIPNDVTTPGGSLGRRASIGVLGVLGRRALHQRASLKSSDMTLGIAAAGHFTVEGLIDLIDSWTEGDVGELVCHPGEGDAALGSSFRWGYRWDQETTALCDPRLREILARRQIELIRPGET